MNALLAQLILLLGSLTVLVGSLGMALPDEFSSPIEIVAAEENYYAKHGEYLQILPNNRLSSKQTGTVAQKLGKKVPDGIQVDIYRYPDGSKGARLRYQDSNAYYSIGIGANTETW